MKIDKKRLKKRINDQDEPKNKGKLHDDLQELHHFILAVQKKDNVLTPSFLSRVNLRLPQIMYRLEKVVHPHLSPEQAVPLHDYEFVLGETRQLLYQTDQGVLLDVTEFEDVTNKLLWQRLSGDEYLAALATPWVAPEVETPTVDATTELTMTLERANKTLKRQAVEAMERALKAEDDLRRLQRECDAKEKAITDQKYQLQASEQEQGNTVEQLLSLRHQNQTQATELTTLRQTLREAQTTVRSQQDQLHQAQQATVAPLSDHNVQTILNALATRITELEQAKVAVRPEVGEGAPALAETEPVEIAAQPAPLTNAELLRQLIANLTANSLAEYHPIERLVQKYNDLVEGDELTLWTTLQGHFVTEDDDRYFVDNSFAYHELSDVDCNGLDVTDIADGELYSARQRIDSDRIVLIRSLHKQYERPASVYNDADLQRFEDATVLAGKNVLIVSWWGETANHAKRKLEKMGANVKWLDTSTVANNKVADEMRKELYDVRIVVLRGAHHETVNEAHQLRREGMNIFILGNPGTSTLVKVTLHATTS
ncbi:phosphoribosyltransferase [Weissella cibaria]|uniref:phosphoribosyltransferase n=1 Tax=Weissella cibaria TaxID=137591 RepID=UPI00223B7FB1|nr:hypothetical protein [Weissella cibaria]MCT0012395.1 hypothetical protein [Weissella cibaria]MCT0950286.1 hypothetical protein [Weissella cibaria]